MSINSRRQSRSSAMPVIYVSRLTILLCGFAQWCYVARALSATAGHNDSTFAARARGAAAVHFSTVSVGQPKSLASVPKFRLAKSR